jgi:ABC-2 type transport system ATP-binding protein
VLPLRVHQCSTGFRQRVGLSTALIHDPPVLLLDEPTHGFDPLQVMAFRDLLTHLKQDRAILFSTHIIPDVEAVSDRVLIIHQGRLLGDGPLREQTAAAGIGEAGLEELFAHLVSTSGAEAGFGR